MLTKVEVTKTYWIGVKADQKDDLLGAVLNAIRNDEGASMDFSTPQIEALNDFRLALLNA